MGAGHSHGSAAGRYRSRLVIAFGLIGGFFFVELVFGLLSGSLALLSDAGHMAADVVTLGAALLATKIATRTDTTGPIVIAAAPGGTGPSTRTQWSSRRRSFRTAAP